MKLDPQFPLYDQRVPRSGRTTAMLVTAIELALEPQRIIVLAHSEEYARNLSETAFFLVRHNELGHNKMSMDVIKVGQRGYRRRLDFPEIGSEILFFSVHMQYPQGLTEFNRTSILIDHFADEQYIGTGGYGTAYRYWQSVIETIQMANADKELLRK